MRLDRIPWRQTWMEEFVSPTEPPRYRTDVLDVLTDILAEVPDVRPGKMFGYPGFYTNGKLFSCVYEDFVTLKLPSARAQELLQRPDVGKFKPMGRVMRDWIAISHSNADDYEGDRDLFVESAAFVGANPSTSKRGRK